MTEDRLDEITARARSGGRAEARVDDGGPVDEQLDCDHEWEDVPAHLAVLDEQRYCPKCGYGQIEDPADESIRSYGRP